MRDSTQVEQVFGFVVTARVVGVLATVRASDGADLEFLPLQERPRDGDPAKRQTPTEQEAEPKKEREQKNNAY